MYSNYYIFAQVRIIPAFLSLFGCEVSGRVNMMFQSPVFGSLFVSNCTNRIFILGSDR